jgi:transcriptional regulator with XRE-family HTH domain
MSTKSCLGRRPAAVLAGAREAKAILATLAREMRNERHRLQMTQQQLADRVGLSRSRIAEIERAEGGGLPVSSWIALGFALNRPLAIGFSRSMIAEPADAGHLAIQEMLLARAERHGWRRYFELATRPARPSLSVDVLLRIDAERLLLIIEIWNRLDDLGAAVRTTHRKQAEAAALAVIAGGHATPYRVATCWVLRDSTANRELARRYPAIFRAEFPGSSRAWVSTFENGTIPPEGAGIVWAHPTAGLSAMNLHRSSAR